MKKLIFAALAGAAFLATPASAAVDVDLDSGTGFVGKGDVQLVYGWNNKGLQDNAASVRFRISSTTEVTWECYRADNDKTQHRANVTSFGGVFTTVARERNQITGFNLTGFSGEPTQESSGDPLYSCPAASSGWEFVPDSVQTSETGDGGLEVSINGADWYAIQ